MFAYRLIVSILVIYCMIPVNNGLIGEKKPREPYSNNKIHTTDKLRATANRSPFRDEKNAANQFNTSHQKFRRKSAMKMEYLLHTSIIFGLTQVSNEGYLNQECYRNLKELQTSVLRKEVWAMKVLDSSGSKEAGFLWGNNYWFGSVCGCEAVQYRVDIALSNRYERPTKSGLLSDLAPFEMEYRVVYVRHNSEWQMRLNVLDKNIIHVGLCLPKSCTNDEVVNMTQTFLNSGFLEEASMYDIKSEVIHIKDLKLKDSFYDRFSLKIVIGALILTGIFMSLAVCQNPLSVGKHLPENEKSSKEKIKKNCDAKLKETSDKQKTFHDVIKCFAVIKNSRTLFSMEDSLPDSIPVLNGLRSISCLCAVANHVIFYQFFALKNTTFLLAFNARPLFKYILTAPPAMEVFFTISGFLSVYNFMRDEKRFQRIACNTIRDNMKEFSKLVLHRYLRLAPLYLITMGMVDIFTTYAQDVSLFHIQERYDQLCPTYGWRNLLFIQNLFHFESMCMTWTWSVACEMQYYVLVFAALFCYTKHPRTVKTFAIFTLIGSILWSLYLCNVVQMQLSFDVVFGTMTEIYINPFLRVTTYIIGCMVGWFLASSKGQFTLNRILEKCLWVISIMVIFLSLYVSLNRDVSPFSTMIILVFGRMVFSLAVAWVILGSATGRAVWWSRLLGWKGFLHFNKISYAVSLLNPLVISIVFTMSETSTSADPVMYLIQVAGILWYIYLASIVFTLCFEVPYGNLSRLILRKVKTA